MALAAAHSPVGRAALCRELGGVLVHERQAAAPARDSRSTAVRSRVLQESGLLCSEELYLCRQNYALRLQQPGSWLLLVLRGRGVLELENRQRQVLLGGERDGGVSLVLTASQCQELTVVQAPLLLLRLRLPSQLSWQPAERELRNGLPLLQPMHQLLLRAQLDHSPSATRQRLAEAMQSYCSDELEALGVQLVSAGHDPLDLLLRWLPDQIGQTLALADLAAAAQLSPRRLQELCHERFGISPMDLLRQQRLEALQRQLQDAAQQHLGLPALMKRLQLADSAATRNAFKQRFGCTPAELRKQLATAGRG